jgi:CxxC motif-containing protein (DUF1111 family)
MKPSLFSSHYVLVPLLVLPLGYRAANWLCRSELTAKLEPAAVQAGRDLFLHEWTSPDALAPHGDGLGPVFNAASCVACHKQGGAGGGGPLENNVTAFVARDLRTIEPARQGVVHAFATAPMFVETLAHVQAGLPPITCPPLEDLLPSFVQGCFNPPRIPAPHGVDISQRNTPALFGAQLVDSIPDHVIIAAERKQRLKWGLANSETEEYPVGRALRGSGGRPGKFGWKAQIATLSDFVRAACANELGLGNPAHAQPAPLAKVNYQPPGLDLTDEQCEQITAFVASLSRPVELLLELQSERDRAAEGKRLFSSIGCADCHIPNLGNVEGIYSDLLLHRMGRTLVAGGSYGEPVLPELVSRDAPDPSEWRTPPLWGVADSAPYLHDGRAATLDDAIRLHGGQGQRSAGRFAQLVSDQKANLLAFLKTLRAPEIEHPAKNPDKSR